MTIRTPAEMRFSVRIEREIRARAIASENGKISVHVTA